MRDQLSSLDENQQQTSDAIAVQLSAATHYTDTGNFSDARYAANTAASEIRNLNRLAGSRRGAPGRLLKLELCYFEIWHVAVIGRKELLTTDGQSPAGRLLFHEAHRQIERLVQDCPDTAKYGELLKLIEGWAASFGFSQNQS